MRPVSAFHRGVSGHLARECSLIELCRGRSQGLARPILSPSDHQWNRRIGIAVVEQVRDNEFGRHIAQPDEIGGRETQCACVTVVDCKAHHDQARAAGAVIVNEYSEKDYGGGGYSCRDPEGHLWYFGSYDPWLTD